MKTKLIQKQYPQQVANFEELPPKEQDMILYFKGLYRKLLKANGPECICENGGIYLAGGVYVYPSGGVA